MGCRFKLYFFFFSLIYFIPLVSSDLPLFLFFCFDESLSRWGFLLVFQQLCFFLISSIFEKTNIKKIFYFLFAEAFLFLTGFFIYKENYLVSPVKLAILLSGASMVYMSLKNRTKWEFGFCFCIYFEISLFWGFRISPFDADSMWGIPKGICIFVGLHFLSLISLLVFWEQLPKRKYLLVPLFFSFIFYLLSYLPELSPLEKWIEGIDLLLCFCCFFSLLEEDETDSKSREEKALRSLSSDENSVT